MLNWIGDIVARVGGRELAVATVSPRRVDVERTTAERTGMRPALSTSALAPPPVPAAPSSPEDWRLPFFGWLVGTPPPLDDTLLAPERLILSKLDAALSDDKAAAPVLSRASSVIPRLLMSLRDARSSAESLAAQVLKDPQLVADVIRLANSTQAAADEPVEDLSQAIGRIGTEGLRRAIARAVVRPIFDARGPSLAGRSAARLWLHTEAQAEACMRHASSVGADPFDGYLAGLLHDAGWSATLRALDRGSEGAPGAFSSAFAFALFDKRDLFFARLARDWELTPALDALSAEILQADAPPAPSSLRGALQAADREAALACMRGIAGPT